MEKITISVTQDDIDEGKPGHCNHCPIAIAARRVFPGMTVRVWDLLTTFGIVKVGYYRMPPEACDFIRNFDRGPSWRVQPFTFEIESVDFVPDGTEFDWTKQNVL